MENLLRGRREHSGDRERSGIKLCSYQLGTAREQGRVPQQSLVLCSDSYAERWLSAQHEHTLFNHLLLDIRWLGDR